MFVCLFSLWLLWIANVKISQNVVLGMQFEVCSLHLNVRAAVLCYVISHTLCLCSCSMLKFTSCIICIIPSGHLGFIRQQESRQIFVVWFSGCCSKSLQVLTVTNLSIKFTLFTTWFLFDGLLHDKTLSSLKRLLLIIHNHPKKLKKCIKTPQIYVKNNIENIQTDVRD